MQQERSRKRNACDGDQAPCPPWNRLCIAFYDHDKSSAQTLLRLTSNILPNFQIFLNGFVIFCESCLNLKLGGNKQIILCFLGKEAFQGEICR